MKRYLFPFLFFIIIIAGCSEETPLSSNNNNDGKIVLKIDGANPPPSVVSVEATLTRSGYEPIIGEMNILNNSNAELTLENIAAGVWNLQVDAKNQDGVVEYSGMTDVTVLENFVTQVTLTLYAVPGGTGGINIFVNWGNGELPIFLIMDEDALDNAKHFNNTGGQIIPGGPQFFIASDVNDDIASETQRNVMRYFESNIGRTITIMSGETGDEGWFAPNCIPAKWINTYSIEDNTCLTDNEQQTAIKNFLGLNGIGSIPSQERLDKIPDVRPLRALGLNRLIDKIVYAVVYDSDISINYDLGSSLGVNGNLQGETLGVVAFRVNEIRTLEDFSSSTLTEVQITILNTSEYENGNFNLLSAPIPASSSVPNDRIAPGSPDGYYSLGN